MDNVFSMFWTWMKNGFEVSMNFFRKIQQLFMSDFLQSKFPKMRWICGMSRTDMDKESFMTL